MLNKQSELPFQEKIVLAESKLSGLEAAVRSLRKGLKTFELDRVRLERLDNLLAGVNQRVDVINSWIKEEPKNTALCNQMLSRLYLLRAQLNSAKPHGQGMAEDCCKSIELDPNNQQAYILHAKINKDNPESVIKQLELALKLEPKKAKYYSRLGEAYHSVMDLTNALTCYDAAIKIDPFYKEAYEGWLNAKITEKGGKKALILPQLIIDLENQIIAQPDESANYIKCALAYSEHMVLSERNYRGEINYAPIIDNFTQAMTLTKMIEKDKEKLIKNFELVYYYKNYAKQLRLEQPRNLAKALECVCIAIDYAEADQVPESAYFEVVKLCLLLDNSKKAIHYYEKNQSRNVYRRHAPLDLYGGQAYLQQKMYPNAILALTEAIDKQKSQTLNFHCYDANSKTLYSAYYYRAKAYFLKGDDKNALADITACISLVERIRTYEIKQTPVYEKDKKTYNWALKENLKAIAKTTQQLTLAYRLLIDVNKKLKIEDNESINRLYGLNPAHLTLTELATKTILDNHDAICEAMDEEFFDGSDRGQIIKLKETLEKTNVTEARCQQAVNKQQATSSELKEDKKGEKSTETTGLGRHPCTIFSKINDYLKDKAEPSSTSVVNANASLDKKF